MTSVMQPVASAVHAAFKLFVDDGLYAAVTIAWITVIVMLGPHGVTGQMFSDSTITLRSSSRSMDGFMLGGSLLALGVDLIFAVSVILRVRSTVRSRSGKK